MGFQNKKIKNSCRRDGYFLEHRTLQYTHTCTRSRSHAFSCMEVENFNLMPTHAYRPILQPYLLNNLSYYSIKFRKICKLSRTYVYEGKEKFNHINDSTLAPILPIFEGKVLWQWHHFWDWDWNMFKVSSWNLRHVFGNLLTSLDMFRSSSKIWHSKNEKCGPHTDYVCILMQLLNVLNLISFWKILIVIIIIVIAGIHNWRCQSWRPLSQQLSFWVQRQWTPS